MASNTIYRSAAGRELIRRWCHEQLDGWDVPHERTVVGAGGAQTHVVSAGAGGTTVVFVPGTNFNAAASLPLATALVAAGHRVLLLDVPGQPGLSSGDRNLSRGRSSWYGAWLDEVIDKTSPGSVGRPGRRRDAVSPAPAGRVLSGALLAVLAAW
ncbi:alpha/beta fold hydrolase [Streptomyces sp. NPDC001552]|uniref:alpha/beta fold hydrolase n=1 Tax=Streptomyces sp. NPDC001552 TaxID=3364587 RepID=UPI003687660A